MVLEGSFIFHQFNHSMLKLAFINYFSQSDLDPISAFTGNDSLEKAAFIAQGLEHQSCKLGVVSSILTGGNSLYTSQKLLSRATDHHILTSLLRF